MATRKKRTPAVALREPFRPRFDLPKICDECEHSEGHHDYREEPPTRRCMNDGCVCNMFLHGGAMGASTPALPPLLVKRPWNSAMEVCGGCGHTGQNHFVEPPYACGANCGEPENGIPPCEGFRAAEQERDLAPRILPADPEANMPAAEHLGGVSADEIRDRVMSGEASINAMPLVLDPPAQVSLGVPLEVPHEPFLRDGDLVLKRFQREMSRALTDHEYREMLDHLAEVSIREAKAIDENDEVRQDLKKIEKALEAERLGVVKKLQEGATVPIGVAAIWNPGEPEIVRIVVTEEGLELTGNEVESRPPTDTERTLFYPHAARPEGVPPPNEGQVIDAQARFADFTEPVPAEGETNHDQDPTPFPCSFSGETDHDSADHGDQFRHSDSATSTPGNDETAAPSGTLVCSGCGWSGMDCEIGPHDELTCPNCKAGLE